jgi:SAM-dependent methyltransferase
MDIFTSLSNKSAYSQTELQLIFGAWVLAGLVEKREKISLSNGDVAEDDYDKRSIYSLLYSLYRTMGTVRSETGQPYEFTFNTWGYSWPKAWGACPIPTSDPQRFGKHAYSGLFEHPDVKKYVREREGKVHVVEMGCGTGAGAHHICREVLPDCTYEAVDMQLAAIETCNRKFVPGLGGRLVATCADATRLAPRKPADFIAVCETHVTEHAGRVTEEDRAFFRKAHDTLKTGGFLVWGNAIPDSTWSPCFDYLASLGMELVESRDVTKEAVAARDEDEPRIRAYIDQCFERFHGFRIPVIGPKRAREARVALENFARNPRTNLYQTMVDGTDSYRVVTFRKLA